MTNAGDNFWPTSDAWIRFVKDHREYLLENSYKHDIERNDIRKFSYTMDGYCKYIGIPASIGWVIIWLNQLDSNFYFDDRVESILVPRTNAMTYLLKTFSTVTSVQQAQLGVIDV
jgi:hypothetical protein